MCSCSWPEREEPTVGMGSSKCFVQAPLLKSSSSFHSELEFSAFIVPSSWASTGCPFVLPSQRRTAFWGQGLAVRALRGAGSPSYSLFFFLRELALLKTSFLRTIFFWVKGEKCSISSKWKALSLPALGTFPRSFFPLREEAAPCKGEKRGDGRSGESSEEVGRKAPVTLETRAVSVRKPEGLFVLDQAWRLEQDWVRK